MTIEVNWDNEKHTIIRYIFQKGWIWDEVDAAFKAADKLMSEVDHKVDVIMDFSPSSLLVPKGAFTHAQRALSNERHANLSTTVIVGSRFVQAIADLARKVARQSQDEWDLVFTTTLAEAYNLLENRAKKGMAS